MTAPTSRRSWLVHASTTRDAKTYSRNICVAVLAENVHDALRAFESAYPEATVWTISHEGKRLIVDSPQPGFSSEPK